MTVEVGQQAPDFELKDQTKKPVRLSDYRGKKAVVIAFYPFTFSGICEGELCSIRDNIRSFSNDDVETLAISVDSPFVHKVWADQQGFEFPLLSDFWPHGAVAKEYGVFNEAVGSAVRGTIIVDKDGTVVFTEANEIGEARDQSAWEAALKEIGAA